MCAPFLASHVPASATRRTCAAAGRIRLVPGRASAAGARAGGPVAVVPPVMGTPLMPPSPPMAVLVASAGETESVSEGWRRTCSVESEVEVWRRECVLRWEERVWWERWLRLRFPVLAPGCLLCWEVT